MLRTEGDMGKLKLASYWAAACGGCDTAILDIHEKIIDLTAAADVLFWPIALDFKYQDVEAMPDGHIDVTLFHGAVRNSENEHLARLLRAKSKVLVAFGTCAHIGGIPGLANLFDREQIFRRVYHDSPSTVNPDRVVPQTRTAVPEGEITIPEFFDTVRTLDQVVDVDYYVPGCPPTPKQIWSVVGTIVSGQLPPKGAILGASEKTQCDECTRKKNEKKISSFKRIATAQPDPETCFLEQGFLCLGPVTRGGCDTRCQNSGVACRGCYGPPPGVLDQGAKAISAIASVLEARDEAETEKIIAGIPDPLRSLNRFGIPGSLLVRKH
jgi:F420-non-reducing hydrogenase small subunit